MKRLLLTAGLAAAVSVLAFDVPGRASAAREALDARGLSSLFDTATGAVRDTNGDGLADLVAARVIVPADPSSEDVQGAANIAGRLAFETTALSLPIVLDAGSVTNAASIELPIVIGRTNSRIPKGSVDFTAMKPGQGVITVVPSLLGGPAGIVIAGADDAGTLAAANAFASSLPRVWGASGARLPQAESQTARYLRSKGVNPSAVAVSGILVDSDRRGIAQLMVKVETSPGETARAGQALKELDAAHRRGVDADTLSFANAAITAVSIWSGGKEALAVPVRRAGLNPRTLTPPDDDDEAGGRGRGGDTPAGGRGGEGRGGAAEAPQAPQGEGGGRGAQAPAASPKTFDLTGVYTIDGWFGDSFVDLIPDRVDTSIVVGGAKESIGAAHIATRLGLETTGITLPLAKAVKTVEDPAREANPILIGRSNDLVQRLARIGKIRLDDLQPGEGAIQTVPRAFGPGTATVIAGADDAGTTAAATYLARRLPYLWDTARGAFELDDLAAQAADFFGARTAGGQASLALRELEETLGTLDGKTIETFEAKVFLEKASPEFDQYLTRVVQEKVKGAKVTASSQGITEPVQVFEDKIDIPWEVDELRHKLKADVLPKIKAGSKVTLEARVSESPQVRTRLAAEITDQLVKAGAVGPKVDVLSAYKQGFLWMTEKVIPELKGRNVRSINVKVAEYKPDLAKKYRFYTLPTRWMHELYPVDEIVERELGIAKTSFVLELTDAKDIYTLEALDAAGRVVDKRTFSPKFVEREYLEKFPGWSRIEVTTGWLSASIDGQGAIDTRIATDPERFWDHYQGKVLPRIYDHVMRVTDNRPTAEKQPFHRDLDVELWMSEPDFRIGVDEEQISALESLHEDIYFVTLDFFNAIGRNATPRARLNGPGKIYPIVHPERAGQAGQARILYAGNASTGARLEISYKEKDIERPTRIRRDLTRIDAPAATIPRTIVRADRVSEIEVHLEPRNDAEALRAADLIDNLARLHGAGMFKAELSYPQVDRLAFTIATGDARARRTVKNTGVAPPSNVRTPGSKPAGTIVTWDHVIGPDESEDLVGKLAAFPEVKAYRAGKSYRGRQISIMEMTLPTPSEMISLAKYTAYKPTIFITGRQHANEVSSTSHILKLGELLATDPSYKEILKKVNVILHPVENPDGAQMAYDLQKLTPHHMLHAGRYSALGMDVGTGNPILPESQVRGRIWREWLPDIYLNPHGYPSHEWVQLFAGYVSPQFRAYWTTRGWWTQLGGVRDPRHPDLSTSTDALRENIVRELNANADVRGMNLRHQARYRKWAFGFAPHVFNQEIYKDTAIYYTDPETGEPRGSRRIPAPRTGPGAGRATMGAWPQVTFNVGMTEAPDETAQGEWLNLVTKAGFSFLMAHVKYLKDGQYRLERIEEGGQRDAVSLTMLRVRPVKPGGAAAATGTNGGR